MVLVVVLPVLKVVDRSLNAEVAASIWDDGAEVRVGGRRVHLSDGEAFIDDEPAKVVDKHIDERGVVADLADETQFKYVAVSQVVIERKERKIKPIEVRIDGADWYIDGVFIGPDDNPVREAARYIGLTRFKKYFSESSLYSSLFNSAFISVVATAIAVLLAFAYAYGITRTCIPGKGFFKTVAMLPLFAPTMLYGLSLVYLFGNKGLVTTGLFGKLPWLAWDIGLYGAKGIIIAESVFIFPSMFLILLVALGSTDARLYEAAESLGASKWRTFWTVTIPGVKFGLLSALFAGFTLCFTDFGAPKVVGGQFNILAVDIYKQVIGQQNFGMGATVSIVLLVPAIAAFVVDRIAQRRQSSAMSAKSVPFTPKPKPATDRAFLVVCGAIAAFILIMLFAAGFGSLVKMWPYDLSLSLKHYTFKDTGGGGYAAFWNSIRMSFYSAILGTAVAFAGAYLIEKSREMRLPRQIAYFLSILPLALPGLVIGIAYIFFFNQPRFEIFGMSIPNPFVALYGTMAILVIANVTHFFTVSFLTATTALRQLDGEFETVSESMGVPFYKTFARVTVPVSLPAIIEIALYFFVSSMATISAVIFLYPVDTPLASVAVINMDDAGDTAPAAAMCMLIVVTNLAVRFGFQFASRGLIARTQAWRQR
ncbi:MAG: putative 2-aminoethylphosphonate ABC transporter permease subunit [Deltaproteobacteria bacterium]|nr:putative 2-aminoethylphosphonate ABC transporter permease subunit [Deltaproteobacteria bacterium]